MLHTLTHAWSMLGMKPCDMPGCVGAPSAASVAERVAVLSFGAINMAMMALMKTLDMLGRERHVVHRERSRGQLGSGLGLGLG